MMATAKPAIQAQRSSTGADQPRDSGESGQYVNMPEGDTVVEIEPKSASQNMPMSPSNIINKADQNERRRRPLPGTWQQCCVIVYHAWLIKMANKTSTLLELALPVIAIGIGLIIPLLTSGKLSAPKAAKELVTPNYTKIYSYDPVAISGASSYLAHGSFVPMSNLLVSPNSPATIAMAKNVFECVLKLAGYTPDGATPATWTSVNTPRTSVVETYPQEDGPPFVVTIPLTTSYVVDKLITGFDKADDAVTAINAGARGFSYWRNQAPVALIFADANVQAPSYSLHFKYKADYSEAKYGDDTRLPDALPNIAGCPLAPIGPLPAEHIEQECYGSYSNCINSGFDCQVGYDQPQFQTPTDHICSSDKYIFAGAAPLQLCVDWEITRKHANNPSMEMPTVSTRMMPRQIVKPEPLDTDVDPSIFFMLIGCGGFTTIFVVWLVMLEKERKLKQMLHMVGVTPTAYWFGWFLGYVTIWAVIGFVLWLMLFLADTSPLKATDGWMLLIVIYMAGINAIVMGFLFVSLFSKAVTGVLCAVTYIFAIAIVYLILDSYIVGGSCIGNGISWALSLLGNYAFVIAVSRMSFITELKGETTWDDFGSKPPTGAMSIGEAFMMQIIDTIIYAILAYYFDQVLPNEHSASRHPLFFLGPSFWRTLFTSNDQIRTNEAESQNAIREVLTELNANPDVESVEISNDAVDHVGITTQKLCKDFNFRVLTSADETKKKLAVDNLSLAVYKNEITAILGHNGAGKTTTIRMLTGQITPTNGTAYILNHNIHTDEGRRAVQATLGLTAQDNILWPTLSIWQHLQIFGRLKNMTSSEIRTNTEKLLKQLGLEQKIYERSSTLSGGQKRRLCLALALIGDPQIVFLDEPSCGVDPQSRRNIWDTLISYKASDKCIVLTTHSMYEADVLADRKLMVSKGKLRCGGSSVFLKNRFGVGYNLNVEFDPQRTVADRQQSVQSLSRQISAIVPNATYPEAYGTNFDRLEVQLPKNEMDKYVNLFALLESDNVAHMGLTDIGVSMVSLEEVFLRLSKEEDDKSNKKRESISTVAEVEQAPISYWTKFIALLRIRFIIWRRRPIRYVATIVVSILLIFIAAYFEELVVGGALKKDAAYFLHEQTKSKIALDLHQYQTMIFSSPTDPLIVRAPNQADYSAATQVLPTMGIQQYTQLPATNSYGDLLAHGLAQDDTAYYYAGADIAVWPRATLPPTTPAEYTVWYNGTFVHSLPLALNVLNSMLYKTLVGSNTAAVGITTKIYQQSVWTNTTLVARYSEAHAQYNQGAAAIFTPTLLTLAFSFFTSILVADAVYDRQTGAIRLLRLSNACGLLYWLPMFIVHVVTYWLPLSVALIIFFNIWTTHFLAYNSLVVFTFILHTFLFVFVMNILAYCASLLFKKVSSATAANEIVSIAAAVTCGISAGFVLFFTVMLKFFSGQVVADIKDAKIVQALSFIFPWWSYAAGLQAIGVAYVIRTILKVPTVWNATTWNDLYVTAFIGLLLWVVISLLILTIAEMFNSGVAQSFMAKHVFNSTTDSRMREQLELDKQTELFKSEENVAEDEDVRAERLLANKSAAVLADQETFSDVEARQSSDPIPAITALHLQKRYGQTFRGFTDNFDSSAGILAGYYARTQGCAVRNVSFRVQPNEIFGLLGPNGAGKTTIMAMLVNEIRPTAGLIYVDRYNTLIQRLQATNLLGYCPQFDALWDEVTVAEHLELMAALHGQQANMTPPNGLIIRMAEKLGLREYWNKNSKNLSGGTKRKLSFLISIIDRNMTSLLDEPSSGMDPGSARYLWDIIKHHFKNRPKSHKISVGGILTTHYMEEAEALCDRIAIMVKGTVRCIGTPTHLRNKFGSGYRLELRLVDAQETTRKLVTDSIMAQFSEAILKKNESRLNRLVFSVPQKQALPLSKSFAFLESQRTVGPSTSETEPNISRKIVEYTITQASIEHVFLRIVGNQDEEEEEQKAVV